MNYGNVHSAFDSKIKLFKSFMRMMLVLISFCLLELDSSRKVREDSQNKNKNIRMMFTASSKEKPMHCGRS